MLAYQLVSSAIPPAFTVIALFVLAVLIGTRGLSRTSLPLIAVCTFAAAWQAAFALMLLVTDEGDSLLLARSGCALIALTSASAWQFVASTLPPATHRKIVAALGWLGAVGIGLLTMNTRFAVADVVRSGDGFLPVGDGGGLAAIAVFAVALSGGAIAELIGASAEAMDDERRRIRSLAVSTALLAVAVTDLIFVARPSYVSFGWLALLAFAILMTYIVGKDGVRPITAALAGSHILSTMRDLVLVCDRDGRIRFANDAAYAFLGCTREELIGRPFADVLVPTGGDDPPSPNGWVRDREHIFRTSLGQPIELTLSHSPLLHEGRAAGEVLVGRDLRDRKRYEWEARRAVTLLESTLDSTADGILVIGNDGHVLTWNQRFVDMWAIPEELVAKDEDQELIGLLVERLVDPAGFLETLAALDQHRDAETVRVLQLEDGRRLEQYSLGRYLDDAPLRVWSFRDVTARLAAEEALRESEARARELLEQVEFQAYHDALTQLPNRRLFVERLSQSLEVASRTNGSLAVLFIDLDRFKAINDTLGHTDADALLVEIANRLRGCVTEADTVARYGGDEFTIILPQLRDRQDAARVAESILERVAQPVFAGSTPIGISASVGIAIYPQDGLDIDALLRNADDAMYRAKEVRNTYR